MRKNLSGRGLVIGVIAAAGASMVLGGCSTPQAQRFRANPTPELMTLGQRKADLDNQFAVMADENLRMFAEDWNKLWLSDRPSRLSEKPVPH